MNEFNHFNVNLYRLSMSKIYTLLQQGLIGWHLQALSALLRDIFHSQMIIWLQG